MSQLLPEQRSRAAPERWEPLSELEQATERMRRMLDQTFASFGWPSPAETRAWSPLVDIEEADDAYVVEAELPGVKRENVNIELVGNELTITGEVKQRKHTGALRRQTRRTGRFAYRVGLPAQVEAENIEASLSDGVLTVRVPKSQPAKRKKIEVKS
jgi:HSP20 family protein